MRRISWTVPPPTPTPHPSCIAVTSEAQRETKHKGSPLRVSSSPDCSGIKPQTARYQSCSASCHGRIFMFVVIRAGLLLSLAETASKAWEGLCDPSAAFWKCCWTVLYCNQCCFFDFWHWHDTQNVSYYTKFTWSVFWQYTNIANPISSGGKGPSLTSFTVWKIGLKLKS